MKIGADPYRLWYFVILVGMTSIGVALLAFRGIVSVIEIGIGAALLIWALIRLNKLPKRWL